MKSGNSSNFLAQDSTHLHTVTEREFNNFIMTLIADDNLYTVTAGCKL